MKTYAPRILLDGLVFPEGPRWHRGQLWFSDMFCHRVWTVDPRGRAKVVRAFKDRPSGIGFLPDGRPLVVAMTERVVYRLDPDGAHVHGDLRGFHSDGINDMVVDAKGRAYVGSRYGDLDTKEPTGSLVLVTPDGKARIVADTLETPNGTVVTPDGKTMIVGETRACRLTAYDIAADGSLSNRRVHADLGDAGPDGLALDAEGGVWLGSPVTREFVRVLKGGTVTDRIPTGDKLAVACALGGEDRRTLFLCTARTTRETIRALVKDHSEARSLSAGFIEAVQVEVPGVGWP